MKKAGSPKGEDAPEGEEILENDLVQEKETHARLARKICLHTLGEDKTRSC